ncbi:MAG: cytochrome C biogenesis protein [Actinomycetota bacterium]|jgi:cytochrome c-type biogenesis protein|nr:cytochrome C biogenesis protein [Actinomycetota bacterium]
MTLLAFAFGAGMLATVNPCGFAVLPAFLAYYVGESDDIGGAGRPSLLARLGRGFSVGFAVSAGFAAVFTASGLLVSLGLRSLVRAVPWAAVGIGGVLVLVGLALVAGRQVGLRVGKDLGPGQGRSCRRMVGFGAGYAVASLSCTLAVLLAVVAQATATSNPFQLAAVFIAYGAGAASVLVSLTVSASLAKATVATAIKRILPVVNRLGGAVLVISGAYLIAYWLPSLVGSGPNRSVAGLSEGPSSGLMSLLDANRGVVAAVGAAFALAGLAVAVLLFRQRSAGRWDDRQLGDCCADEASITGADPNRERVAG